MFPNPPLDQIKSDDLMTVAQAAAWIHVKPVTIRQWIHRGKLTHVDVGGGGPKLYHRDALAKAEREAWDNGADRPIRGGRKRDLQRARAA
ncbi:helix-turn-helix domain-containing protein [Streptomyces sp. HNM0645]|uniref:helix-turn-helix domain-containing protein n=1 Tax=Streptomyces sp. HNM0645 TaxID=2782343 RepID=UPI0024B749F6|nr:helix-turn-helix domain-containing protein [Streptomyces sp. HNM0645]MDI9885921.1 helix-turn-helix domain-containing protein [Streptomyces sp. HNM0645]